jgi:tetratricopeptide (TPR) repeat protein
MLACPSPAAIQAFVARASPEAVAREVEAHIAGCDACRVLVSALAKEAYSAGAETQTSGEGKPPLGVLARGAPVGRYLVLSLLARGGMGEVYVAYDPELDRRVALKLLHTENSTPAARQRLLREARGLGKLSHPHVVQIHDVGEQHGDIFIAMELVEGQNLGAWARDTPRPSWQEILSAYLDAGRGLAAAHARGLIHRDVKPSNLMRGKDGRVRVVDFGLVSHAEEPGDVAEERADPSLPSATPAAPALTAAGAILGTPRYMAPEQFGAARVGPASDQYALALSLYEALYGKVPFKIPLQATTREELAAIGSEKKGGVPPAPPEGTRIPARVYAVLRRALSPRPEDRFPTIDALLTALSFEANRSVAPRRRAVLIAGALCLAAVAGMGWFWSRSPARLCAHREQELQGVWDDSVRSQVTSAFVATGRPYASDAVHRLTVLLDDYAGRWTAMRREVCEASLRSARPSELLRARDACLDRRLSRMRALTHACAGPPDVGVLDSALPASAELPRIEDCADLESLLARVRPPESPALRARVARAEPRVDEVETLYSLGKYASGVAAGESLLPEVKEIPYPPLLARTEYELGRLRFKAGDNEGAKRLLKDAAAAAAQGGDDALVINAWAQVLYVVGERERRADETLFVLSVGPTVLGRPHDALAEAAWLNSQGLALYRLGRAGEAESSLSRASELVSRELPPDHPRVLQTLNNLGIVLHEMGKDDEARALYERVLAARERILGSGHPSVAGARSNLGMVLFDSGELALARQAHEQALAVREQTLGPKHPDVALSLNNAGDAAREMGDFAAAKVFLQRALEIREAVLEPRHPDIAQSLVNLGLLSYETGDFADARDRATRALASMERTLPPQHPDLAYPLVGLGRAETRLGQWEGAQRALERARALRQTGGQHRALAEPLLGLGELALAKGEASAAAGFLEEALALGDAHVEREVKLALAESLWRLAKDRTRALELASQAKASYERIGHRPGAQRAAAWLAAHVGRRTDASLN